MLLHKILKPISALFFVFIFYIPSANSADNKLLNLDITDSFPAINLFFVFFVVNLVDL